MNVRKGFTLIELMLAIALMAIVVGFAAPLLLSYQRSSILATDIYKAQESIRRAQTLASNSQEDSNWGAYVTNNDITVYKGNNYGARDVNFDETVSLSNITLVSGTIEFNFDVFSGETLDTGTLTFSVDNKTKGINVNEKGLVAQ